MMTLHDLPEVGRSDHGFVDVDRAKAAAVQARDEIAIRDICRERVHRLVADEMTGLHEAAIDALFNELSAWLRREGRAHRRMASTSGSVQEALLLPDSSDAASPAVGCLQTCPLQPGLRFQATPARDGNAMSPAPSLQGDPAGLGTASGSRLADALRRLRIRGAALDAADETLEVGPHPYAAGSRADRPHLPLPEAETIDGSGSARREHSDQSSSAFSLDRRFRFKRLDRSEIGALAHRICDGGKKSKPDADAGDAA